MYNGSALFIACQKIFFTVFGLFGNLNLLYIILSTPKLRNKSSYLQCVQSAAHVFCLMNSLIDVYLLFTETRIPRDTCFHFVFPVVFCFCVQVALMFCILLDILLNLLLPLHLQNIKDWKYVLSMSAGPCLFGAIVVLFGFQTVDGRMLFLCNPPSVLKPSVRKVTFLVIAAINTLSLFLFVILIFIFRKKGHKQSYCWKVMAHLKVSAVLFIVSTFFSTSAASFLIMIGYSGDDFYTMIAHLSIFAMLAYSHTFYTIIWRSAEYRSRFISIYNRNSGSNVVNIGPSSRIKHPSAHSEF